MSSGFSLGSTGGGNLLIIPVSTSILDVTKKKKSKINAISAREVPLTSGIFLFFGFITPSSLFGNTSSND
jgi:hypothetical protein